MTSVCPGGIEIDTWVLALDPELVLFPELKFEPGLFGLVFRPLLGPGLDPSFGLFPPGLEGVSEQPP